MTLITRFLAARRDKLLMKLGCWLVCFSLILGLMLPQQRAEALVAELTIGSVAALAASYLCACGLPLVTQGMDRDALVSSVQRLIQEFLDTELNGATIQEWLGSIWDVVVMAGKLVMGRPLTNELVDFAQWVAGKYGTQTGVNMVYDDGEVNFRYHMGLYSVDDLVFPSYITFYNRVTGTNYLGDIVCHGCLSPGVYEARYPSSDVVDSQLSPVAGTFYVIGVGFRNDSGSVLYPFKLGDDGYYSGIFEVTQDMVDQGYSWTIKLLERNKTAYSNVPSVHYPLVRDTFYLRLVNAPSLGLDRAPSMSYIPEGIAEGQGVALDVGAAATMDLDLVCHGVLDDVLAGTLTSTMEAAGEKEEEKPVAIPDVGELGLPSLGTALTTRFPFSIPWDFFRAVQLLAAPAKAPYFEVDFMEPLADDVGGWQGDTTVVLDFSEYAIIGQISRWTSTIGFCLMLAGATKRLIWTA